MTGSYKGWPFTSTVGRSFGSPFSGYRGDYSVYPDEQWKGTLRKYPYNASSAAPGTSPSRRRPRTASPRRRANGVRAAAQRQELQDIIEKVDATQEDLAALASKVSRWSRDAAALGGGGLGAGQEALLAELGRQAERLAAAEARHRELQSQERALRLGRENGQLRGELRDLLRVCRLLLDSREQHGEGQQDAPRARGEWDEQEVGPYGRGRSPFPAAEARPAAAAATSAPDGNILGTYGDALARGVSGAAAALPSPPVARAGYGQSAGQAQAAAQRREWAPAPRDPPAASVGAAAAAATSAASTHASSFSFSAPPVAASSQLATARLAAAAAPQAPQPYTTASYGPEPTPAAPSAPRNGSGGAAAAPSSMAYARASTPPVRAPQRPPAGTAAHDTAGQQYGNYGNGAYDGMSDEVLAAAAAADAAAADVQAERELAAAGGWRGAAGGGAAAAAAAVAAKVAQELAVSLGRGAKEVGDALAAMDAALGRTSPAQSAPPAAQAAQPQAAQPAQAWADRGGGTAGDGVREEQGGPWSGQVEEQGRGRGRGQESGDAWGAGEDGGASFAGFSPQPAQHEESTAVLHGARPLDAAAADGGPAWQRRQQEHSATAGQDEWQEAGLHEHGGLQAAAWEAAREKQGGGAAPGTPAKGAGGAAPPSPSTPVYQGTPYSDVYGGAATAAAAAPAAPPTIRRDTPPPQHATVYAASPAPYSAPSFPYSPYTRTEYDTGAPYSNTPAHSHVPAAPAYGNSVPAAVRHQPLDVLLLAEVDKLRRVNATLAGTLVSYGAVADRLGSAATDAAATTAKGAPYSPAAAAAVGGWGGADRTPVLGAREAWSASVAPAAPPAAARSLFAGAGGDAAGGKLAYEVRQLDASLDEQLGTIRRQLAELKQDMATERLVSAAAAAAARSPPPPPPTSYASHPYSPPSPYLSSPSSAYTTAVAAPSLARISSDIGALRNQIQYDGAWYGARLDRVAAERAATLGDLQRRIDRLLAAA